MLLCIKIIKYVTGEVKTCQFILKLLTGSFKIKFSAFVPEPEAKIIIFFIFVYLVSKNFTPI